jgi:gamma-glutamyltranspeptidase/glutathione hydrolase
MNPQEALAASRFHYLEADRVALEAELEREHGQELAARGHQVLGPDATLGRGGFGGAQAIAVDADGTYWGASDPRKDGCAAAF